jgi:hypothetical protein
MKYLIVSNGSDYGTLEEGKPVPYGFYVLQNGARFTKEEAQAWYDEEMYTLSLLEN